MKIVHEESQDQQDDQYCGAINFDQFIGAVHCDDADSAWKVTLDLGGSSETFKIDTGTDVSIMSYTNYRRVPSKAYLVGALPVK